MGQTIISSTSPLTGLKAEVIIENDCSYFYLYHPEAVGNEYISESSLSTFAACWIKNHVKVSDIHSIQDDVKKSLQPKMPTKYCAYPDDLAFLVKENLEIVWGKEGSMAGLYEKDELICVIPYWTDLEFNGYSKYSRISDVALVPSPLVRHISGDLFERMEEARAFWKQDFHLLWRNYKLSYLNELKRKYGKVLKYYAIDKGKFPSRGLAVFEKEDIKYAFTLGIGLFPQPKIDLHIEKYQNYQLFEMAFCYRTDIGLEEQKVFSQIASIISRPWTFNTFLDYRHAVDLQINEEYESAIIIADKNVNLTESEFLIKQNINLLWLVPVTNESFTLISQGGPYR